MLSRLNDELSAMLRSDTRFTGLVHFVMTYAMKFELKYDVHFLQAQASDIACIMQSSRLIHDASISLCFRYTCVANLFLKNYSVFMFGTEQSRQSSGGYGLGLIRLGGATLFSSHEVDERLLVMTADSRINNHTLSASVHEQSICHFGNKVLSAYCKLQNHVSRWNAMDGLERVSFDGLPNFMVENMATRMSQGLTVLQKYLNVICVFSCDVNDQRRL